MKQHFLAVAFLLGLASQAASQSMVSFGPGINRYGVSLSFKYHSNAAENRKLTASDWLFEMGNIQHPRELARVNTALQSSGIYKFGKINYAWSLRPYYMGRLQLSTRQDKKSVALNAIGGVGIPIAYTWPVYILLYDPQSGPGEAYVEARYDPAIHQQAFIGGRAPFSRGFGDGKFTPGIGLNTGLEFSWGNYRSDVKIITFGMRTEAYAKPLPILHVNELNKSVFSMFYLTFAFGFGNP